MFKQSMTTEEWISVDRLKPEARHSLAQELIIKAKIADPGKMRLTGYLDESGVAHELDKIKPCSKGGIDEIVHSMKASQLVISVYTGMQQVNHFVPVRD
jgi:hypothetical protein